MTDKIENFNGPFPCSLILKNFFHRNGFDVERFATMRRSNGVFEFGNLSGGIRVFRYLRCPPI